MRMIPTYRNAGDEHDRFSLTSLISRCRTKADERSWRRAAYRSRSNWAWDWLFGAAFAIVIIFTSLVWTQQHLATTQSELETAEQAAALMEAEATELTKRFASLNSSARKRTLSAMSFKPNLIRPRRKPKSPNPS